MKFYQRIINRRLVIAGLAGLLGCDEHPDTPKVNYKEKTAIAQIQSTTCYGPAIAAADMDGDSLIDLLSADDDGNVYIHKNQGRNVFVKIEKPVLNVQSTRYYGPAIAAADMDGDGLTDLLSADNYGNVYIHKNLGKNKFQQ